MNALFLLLHAIVLAALALVSAGPAVILIATGAVIIGVLAWHRLAED